MSSNRGGVGGGKNPGTTPRTVATPKPAPSPTSSPTSGNIGTPTSTNSDVGGTDVPGKCKRAPAKFTNSGTGHYLNYRRIGLTSRYIDQQGPFPYKGDSQGYNMDYFITHRSGKSFKYIFDDECYSNGHLYRVVLGFAENRVCRDNARVFSVNVNGKPFITDMDVYQKANGCRKALVLSGEFYPNNDQFEIEFVGTDGHRAMISFVEIVAVEGRRNLLEGCKA